MLNGLNFRASFQVLAFGPRRQPKQDRFARMCFADRPETTEEQRKSTQGFVSGARLVDFDQERYRQRNIVERLIGWLKECRCVFARFEKTAVNFSGMIKMAFIQRYLKLLAP
jgi:transposase